MKNTPKKNEVTLKAWIIDQAARIGISPSGVHRRLMRGKLACPPMRRVNQRVIFVRV